MKNRLPALTYTAILAAEGKIPPIVGGSVLRDEVNYLLAHAEDNMPDDAGRIDSLRCMLCGGTYAPVTIRWFRDLGLTW